MLGKGSIGQLAISSVPVLAPGAPPATSPWSIGINQTRSIRRRNTTDRQVRTVSKLLSTPLAASSSRSLLVSFKTTTTASRKLQAKGWFAAMVPTGTPAVVPASAYLKKATYRRKATKRRLIEVTDFLSNYIAPTIGAVKLDIKPFRIEYKRELRLTPPQALYPPPTGPPNFIFTARPKRVSQARRFVAAPAQILYPVTPVTPQLVQPITAIKQRKTGRKLIRAAVAPVYPVTPVTLSADRQLTEPFSTRVGKSRKSISIGWMGALVAYAPAAIPFVAPALKLKRSETKRKLRQVVPASDTPLAPSAVLFVAPAQKLIRRSTERKLRAPPNVPVYPAPTVSAVPFSAIAATRHKKRPGGGSGFVTVSVVVVGEPAATTTPAQYPSFERYGYQKRKETGRRLKTAVVAPVFPYSAPSASPDRQVAEAFKTKVGKSRKRQAVPGIFSFPVTPPTPANFAALTQPKTLKRRDIDRKPRNVADAPVYPATPPAPVVFSAIVRPKTNILKPQNTGFVSVSLIVGFQVEPFVATQSHGFNRRRETERKHLRAVWPLVYPQTPAPAVTFSALTPIGFTRSEATRRLLTATWPLVYPQTPAPAVTFSALVSNGYIYRRNSEYKLLNAAWPLVYPQTPPVPEQPFEAFKTVLSKYAAGLTRKILGVYAPQNIEAAPDIPPVIVPGGGGGGGAGWKKHHEHKRRKDRELEDTIRQIYRELTQEPATTDIAVQIVAPITKPEAKAVPTVQQVEFEKATVEIETALRLVRNQIEDFKRAEENDRQELLEIIEIMHLGGLI